MPAGPKISFMLPSSYKKNYKKSFCHQFYILNNYEVHNVIVLFPSDWSISVQKVVPCP